MFPSVYLNCSDAPSALYPRIKALLLFTEAVHIMNPNPIFLEKNGGISPGDFLTLCHHTKDGEPPPIRPICRDSFLDPNLRKDRVDIATQDFDTTFYRTLSSVCGESGRILGPNSYDPARQWTEETFKGLGEKSLSYIGEITKEWINCIPRNRAERMRDMAAKRGKSLDWIFVDTIHQEFYVKLNSGAVEHTPTPLDLQALMHLNAFESDSESRNFVALPHVTAERSNRLIDLVNDLFPVDILTPSDLSSASAEDILRFRQAHRTEIDRLAREIWFRAARESRDPVELAKHYARDRHQEIEDTVRNVINGVGQVATLIEVTSGDYIEAAHRVGQVGGLMFLYEYIPRLRSALNNAARLLNPADRKIIFSSYVYLDLIGKPRGEENRGSK